MTIRRKEDRRRAGIGYVLEAAAGVAFAYFFLGGNQWNATLWAAFAVIAIWIVVMNVRRDAGFETEAAYSRWRLHFGFLFVVALLLGAVRQASPWLLGLAVILGWFWIRDWRSAAALSRPVNRKLMIFDDHHR